MKQLLGKLFATAFVAALSTGIGPCDDQPIGTWDGGAAGAVTGGKAGGAGKGGAGGTGVAPTGGVGTGGAATGGVGTGGVSVLDAGASTCEYAKKTYPSGATFPSTDGCNVCTCLESSVACTEKACLPVDAGTGGTIGGICKYDQDCNDNPAVSALYGKCITSDAHCECGNFVLNPKTGKCVVPGGSANGCTVNGQVHAIGTSFICPDGCNVCECIDVEKLNLLTNKTCSPTDGAVLTCGFADIYVYSRRPSNASYEEQITIGTTVTSTVYSYRRTVTTSSGATTILTCAPPWPKCGDPQVVDVSDIVADLMQDHVQKYLSGGFVGLGRRDVPPLFTFTRSDGHGFSIGPECAPPADCQNVSIVPDPIAKLVQDLELLDKQQTQASVCAGLKI